MKREKEGGFNETNARIAKLEGQVQELTRQLAEVMQGAHLKQGNGIVINGTMISLATPQQNWPLPTQDGSFLGSPNGVIEWVVPTEC